MLFTQFDLYRIENQSNGKEEDLAVYTGILQFPKKLSENWNLINRVIWTVPSMPLDQDKIDDFEIGVGPGGGPLPGGGGLYHAGGQIRDEVYVYGRRGRLGPLLGQHVDRVGIPDSPPSVDQ